MTSENATPSPKRPGRPARGPKYPAQIVVMVTPEMRRQVDAIVEETSATLGEVTRALIEDGLRLSGAELSAAHDG